MRRKIKFPLILKDEKEARNIDELRANFDLEKVINYYLEGKLQRWLQDRNYEEELGKIKELNIDSNKFSEELCISLDIDYKKYKITDIQNIAYRNDKVTKLRDYLEDEKINEIIDYVVFNQEELTDFITDNKKIIYLYNGEYIIDFDKENIKYIGIGKVSIKIKKSENIDLNKKNIVLQNVKLESKNNIAIISKKSKYLDFNENITYKVNNYEEYDVVLKERLIDKKTASRLGYTGGFVKTIEGITFYILNGLYRIHKDTLNEELIIDDTINKDFRLIEAYYRNKEKIFYVKRTGYKKCSIFKVNLDGSEKQELITDVITDDILGFYFKHNICEQESLLANDEYIIWITNSEIYRWKHDSSEEERIIHNGYTITDILSNNIG